MSHAFTPLNLINMEFFRPTETLPTNLPLFSTQVEAGFPSVADDHIEQTLDLQRYLIPRPAATFFVKAKGESMVGAGIFPGDLLIVDKSLQAKSGSIIIALYQGEFTVKRLIIEQGQGYLKAENPAFPTIAITHIESFEIWGTVTHVIHSV
jgi:DNA polymerase V